MIKKFFMTLLVVVVVLGGNKAHAQIKMKNTYSDSIQVFASLSSELLREEASKNTLSKEARKNLKICIAKMNKEMKKRETDSKNVMKLMFNITNIRLSIRALKKNDEKEFVRRMQLLRFDF